MIVLGHSRVCTFRECPTQGQLISCKEEDLVEFLEFVFANYFFRSIVQLRTGLCFSSLRDFFACRELLIIKIYMWEATSGFESTSLYFLMFWLKKTETWVELFLIRSNVDGNLMMKDMKKLHGVGNLVITRNVKLGWKSRIFYVKKKSCSDPWIKIELKK